MNFDPSGIWTDIICTVFHRDGFLSGSKIIKWSQPIHCLFHPISYRQRQSRLRVNRKQKKKKIKNTKVFGSLCGRFHQAGYWANELTDVDSRVCYADKVFTTTSTNCYNFLSSQIALNPRVHPTANSYAWNCVIDCTFILQNTFSQKFSSFLKATISVTMEISK